MTRLQWGSICAALALIVLLFFGFDTKSSVQKDLLETQQLAGTKIEISEIEKAAKESLAVAELKTIQVLEHSLEISSPEAEERVELLKQLSSKWYQNRYPFIAGHYAEKVAELIPSGTSWGIAGTTYLAGITSIDPAVKSGSFHGAIRALENAISLDPDTSRHRVNLALAYTENPPPDNPMQGIQMLLALNERNPKDIVVLNTLARLAVKTGQFEKAIERLLQALAVDEDNLSANCLLADVFSTTKDSRAENQRNKCELLTTKEK